MSVPLLAVAHLPHLTPRGWVVLVLAALAWLLIYLTQCCLWPFAACLACKGQGRRYQNAKRKAWRDCWWCKGAGRRLRVGRRVWAHFAHTKRNAR